MTLAPTSSGASSAVLHATLTLTNAQILTLPTAAVEIVATPGSGNIVVPYLIAVSKTLAGAYTNVDSGANLAVAYGGTVSGGLTCLLVANSDSAIFTSASANKHWLAPIGANFSGFQQLAPPDNGDPRNTNLMVTATNASAGNFTGGNAANTMEIQVYYVVATVAV